MELRLDLSKSFWENMGYYHERVKKLRRKISKLEELLSQPIENKKEEKAERRLIRKRKREWYERFRWTFTSNGFLVIAGRDAKSNEILVRKYLGEKDLFFHADVVGAPATVLKNGQDAQEKDIFEAAIFAASMSRAWKSGWSNADVFYVLPEQVSLSPPSGEYRPKGGVMIYGKKEWVRKVPLQIYVSFDEGKQRFFVSAFSPKRYVLLVPGRTEKTEIAKKILQVFGKGTEYLDDLNALLPPGPSELKEKCV